MNGAGTRSRDGKNGSMGGSGSRAGQGEREGFEARVGQGGTEGFDARGGQGGTDACAPRIKICGLRRLEDVRAVNEVLPEYAGFVFAESRRRVTPEEAAVLIRAMDARILPVGVFVDASPEEVARVAREAGLEAVQLHGAEGAEEIRTIRALAPSLAVWKAVRVKAAPDSEQLRALGADLLLLDAWHPTEAGGAGVPFEWALAEGVGMDYLLAGGLTPENVRDAVVRLAPYGVDVSSGVETEGWKDAEKIRAFVRAVRGG